MIASLKQVIPPQLHCFMLATRITTSTPTGAIGARHKKSLIGVAYGGLAQPQLTPSHQAPSVSALRIKQLRMYWYATHFWHEYFHSREIRLSFEATRVSTETPITYEAELGAIRICCVDARKSLKKVIRALRSSLIWSNELFLFRNI